MYSNGTGIWGGETICAQSPVNTKHLYNINFIQRRPNVFDVGSTLYKCYTNALCFLGGGLNALHPFIHSSTGGCLRERRRSEDSQEAATPPSVCAVRSDHLISGDPLCLQLQAPLLQGGMGCILRRRTWNSHLSLLHHLRAVLQVRSDRAGEHWIRDPALPLHNYL